MMKPPRLRPGSLIGLVAPASPVPDGDALSRGQSVLETLGFRVRPGRHLACREGYLAGTDQARAEDLNEMFADSSVDAVFCVRGGYGAARLLDRLDFTPLKTAPKIFLGYSDITALELAILRETGLVTFYGPMVTTELARNFLPHNRQRLLDALMRTEPPPPISPSPEGPGAVIIHPGVAEGLLIGGCLSVLVSLLGTPHMPPLGGAILLLEDLDEEPYRLDRYLTQLRLSGELGRAAGVAVGHLVNCEPREDRTSYIRSRISTDVLHDRLGDLGIPILAGLGFGHGRYKATIPQGVPARLDASGGVLQILESGVR
jgi:muramoyltetrapeptide carboxypeptidase